MSTINENQYAVLMEPDEDGDGWHASVPELKGCVAWGPTQSDAIANITAVRHVWLELAQERGWRIP